MRAAQSPISLFLITLLLLCEGHIFGAPTPVMEWRFEAVQVTGQTVKASVGGLDGTATKLARLSASPAYMDFDGTQSVLVKPKGEAPNLPAQKLTVEVWVALRETCEWGGFVGYFQDNGTFEKGWVLGNRRDSFSFGLSSKGADDGDGSMTYLVASQPVPLRKWCHVVGTYDGSSLHIYVNGELSASSKAQKGDLLYTPADLMIGAYKDDDEFNCMDGALNLVRLYDTALTADEVRERYAGTRQTFDSAPPLAVARPVFEPILIDGPWASFGPQGVATIRWDTKQSCPSVLKLGKQGDAPKEVRTEALTTSHSVRLEGLEHNTTYHYSISAPLGDTLAETPTYSLDTQFDYSPSPLPAGARPYPAGATDDLFARAAEFILRESGIDRGYCLDLGCGDGRLGWEIARRSGLRVVGVSTDAAALARGREALLAAGCYGPRLTLHKLDSLADLPFADYTFNLVISDEALTSGALPSSAAEVFARLRPLGGRAYVGAPAGKETALQSWLRGADGSDRAPRPAIGATPPPRDPVRRLQDGPGGKWAILEHRESLPGAGEWTHAYGNAAQTAGSGDYLVYGTTGDNLEVQWFGLPGPNAMVDRLARKQGPLSTAGRLFTLANDRLIAQDAYNGTILWSTEMPGLLRNNLPRNTGNACANDDYLFVAMRDRCWRFDTATGQRSFSYPVTKGQSDDEMSWGYVACSGGVLVGSAVRRGNFETEYKGPRFWFDGQTGRDVLNVCSDGLFACAIDDGTCLWTYSGGLVINSTLAMSGGRLYFLESRAPEALEAVSRQLGAPLWSDVRLVALDVRTGQVLWTRPFEHPEQPIVVYLLCDAERLAVVSSLGGKYRVRTFSTGDGAPGWQVEDPWRTNNHGHHIQHPVLTMGRLFLEPHVYDWETGSKFEVTFPGRSKCGTITAAATLLHYRDYSDEVWNLTTNTQSEFNLLRSGCWIGMISGNGLLMSPESAGGCTCRWPIYTSLTYRTKNDY